MEAHGSELKEIRFPMSTGLAGYAASNGEIVTVEDAYDDIRFNRQFDEQTGYRTRDVLAVPVRSRTGEIVGVTQAINKQRGTFDQPGRRVAARDIVTDLRSPLRTPSSIPAPSI